jgi:hypothetical protein
MASADGALKSQNLVRAEVLFRRVLSIMPCQQKAVRGLAPATGGFDDIIANFPEELDPRWRSWRCRGISTLVSTRSQQPHLCRGAAVAGTAALDRRVQVLESLVGYAVRPRASRSGHGRSIGAGACAAVRTTSSD